MIAQCTLKTGVTTTGVGLHTGEKVRLGLRPAPPDTGVVFRRTDLEGAADIPATADAVRDTRMSSCLIADSAAGEIRVSTVEHLMSALCGLGVDNVYVDVSAAEIPILDGSAASFVYLIQSAGLTQQSAPRRFIRVRKAVEVREGEGSAAKWARLEPHLGFKLAFSIDFSHPAVDKTGQRSEFDFAESAYTKEIARARTFGFTRDVETLRANGLALGGSLDNAIVMDEFRVLNADGLRYADEFVKHKMLDAIGDLYLAGHPLLGAYTAHKSGHALNNRLVRALLADAQAWDLFSFADEAAAPAYLRPGLGLGAAW